MINRGIKNLKTDLADARAAFLLRLQFLLYKNKIDASRNYDCSSSTNQNAYCDCFDHAGVVYFRLLGPYSCIAPPAS